MGLWPQHVEQELAQPPHHRVTVQPGQPTGRIRTGGTPRTGIATPQAFSAASIGTEAASIGTEV